ncbi:unnamed protein product [Adineta steineri]|uniref:RCC1-like domain-containing protein n=1 Tax=Adineta steineri TaxID=433720 RepID=A0A813Q027_9BILA|nr:unnamed protein product [Adineta steineri]
MNSEEDDDSIPHIYLLGKTYLPINEKFHIRNDPIIHMAAGDRHSIIVTESGRAFAFGDNNSGQLGLGHTNNIDKVSCIKSLKFGDTGEKIILAACGRESSLIATNQGSLYGFGSNNYYQLGIDSNESTTIYSYPVKIKCFNRRISWKEISMGAEHSCALTIYGEVYVWGSNEDGQCGYSPNYSFIKLPEELRLEYSVFSISCGYYHTALINENHRLFLCGNNENKQFGRTVTDQYISPLEVSLPEPVKAVACGNQYTVVLTENGNVYTCGRGDRGQLGLGVGVPFAKYFECIKINLPDDVISIAAGEAHTAILSSQGDLYVFGDGKHGKLSYGAHSNEFQPCSIEKFKRYNVTKVVCGGCLTVVLAQSRLFDNEEDSENSENKITKNIARLNHQLTMTKRTTADGLFQYNESSRKRFPLHSESNLDSDSSSTSIESVLKNTTHIGINGQLKPLRSILKSSSSSISSKDSKTLRTDVYDNMTDNLTKSTNHISSTDKSYKYDTKLDCTNRKQNSSSEESSTSTSEENQQIKSSDNNNINTNTESIVKTKLTKNVSNGQQSESSTSVSRSTTDTSNDENQAIPLGTIDNLHNSFPSHPIINSYTESNESQPGFFSRFFLGKSSQNLPPNKNKNSRICSIM